MLPFRRSGFNHCAIYGVVLTLFIASGAAHAGHLHIRYAFPELADGYYPNSRLLEDKSGNLYGTTEYGGNDDDGAVFKVSPDKRETVLYSFTDGADGAGPIGGLIMDQSGNLYGVTTYGGDAKCSCGTVYRLSPDGTETTLHDFHGVADGENPGEGLVMDGAGNLYGTTQSGGSYDCGGGGCGAVFEIFADGRETLLYVFGSDGEYGDDPVSALILDGAGNLYGTTAGGGGTGCGGTGCGTVYKVAPNRTETVLYSFQGGSDGEYPQSGLTEDQSGNLFGTTPGGGGLGCLDYGGCGTVFELAANGTETVLHRFSGADGNWPVGQLVEDAAGNLYGETFTGGPKRRCSCGTVFGLAPDGTETKLRAFVKQAVPAGGLIADEYGDLLGVTSLGGDGSCSGEGCGTIFKLTNFISRAR